MIIGLVGKKRVGKDTVADYLCNKYGFIKYGFADPIKQIGQLMFDFSPDEELKEVVDKRWGISPREFYQKFGTEYGQYILPNQFPQIFKNIDSKSFWVKRFQIWYEKNKDKKIVITDIRFLHEFNIIKDMGGYIIKIKRETGLVDNHISENLELSDDNFSSIVHNNGTKDQLLEKIKYLKN